MITPYHALYYAHELTRAGAVGEVDQLSRALFDSKVDLNPHQVDAALFALSNPLRKGVILADEVGLGKTIEAGLVLCQLWAERKRKLIVMCPAHISKQWATELKEKFHLPAQVVDRKLHRQARKAGKNPFDADYIAVISYGFAVRMKDELRPIPFDLVVMDEAHKLRNAWQEHKRVGQAIHFAFAPRQKLLLTATPLQNSLIELYGLGWMIDEHIFGDKSSFQSRYASAGGDLPGLRQRLQQFVKRTLRKDCPYVNYTARRALTLTFDQSQEELSLQSAVTDFLRRPHSYALPERQRELVEMIVFKTLASSPKALAGTMKTMRDRLVQIRDQLPVRKDDDDLDEFSEDADFDVEEWFDLLDDDPQQAGTAIDGRLIAAEISDLDRLIGQADRMSADSKAAALLKALDKGFRQMTELGAQRKALLFTESRRTQEFLADFLEKNGYGGKVISFNGSNSHPRAKLAYEEFMSRHGGSDKITGSRAIDTRSALVEAFRDEGQILLATEAAAEGVNLQFCSLVINYDLPWNPQRIEQRIGRCHRYGQKFDVVVVNFLSSSNLADQRIQELLQQKFSLFNGLFGASDEVLGAIESGVDFERRVLQILRSCRNDVEIASAFDALQKELEDAIASRMKETKEKLFTNFDADVHERLKMRDTKTHEALDRVSTRFWKLSRWALAGCAEHFDDSLCFQLPVAPAAGIPTGRYQLISAAKTRPDAVEAHLLRLSSPLGQWILDKALSEQPEAATVSFRLSGHPVKISMLEPFKNKSGYLSLELLSVAADAEEQFLLFSAVTDDGRSVDNEIASRLFDLEGEVLGYSGLPAKTTERLAQEMTQTRSSTLLTHSQSLGKRLACRQQELENWADDKIEPERRKLAQIEDDKRSARRDARLAPTLDDKLAAEARAHTLEKAIRSQEDLIRKLRNELDDKLDTLCAELRERAAQKTTAIPLFSLRWQVL